MTRSFADARTARLFEHGRDHGVDSRLWQRIRGLLDQVEAARRLEDFCFPPSNRFHRLRGGRTDRHALRVNRQYRTTFAWQDGDAYDIRFEDYH